MPDRQAFIAGQYEVQMVMALEQREGPGGTLLLTTERGVIAVVAPSPEGWRVYTPSRDLNEEETASVLAALFAEDLVGTTSAVAVERHRSWVMRADALSVQQGSMDFPEVDEDMARSFAASVTA